MKGRCVRVLKILFAKRTLKGNISRLFFIGISFLENATWAFCSYEKALLFWGSSLLTMIPAIFIRLILKAPLGVCTLLHLSFVDATEARGTVFGTCLRPRFGVHNMAQILVSPG